jgi:hypothetical protein
MSMTSEEAKRERSCVAATGVPQLGASEMQGARLPSRCWCFVGWMVRAKLPGAAVEPAFWSTGSPRDCEHARLMGVIAEIREEGKLGFLVGEDFPKGVFS